MELRYEARAKEQLNTDYQGLEKHNLTAIHTLNEGDGRADTPFRYKITIKNNNPSSWEGVIHIELSVLRHAPQFFLPAFMYGSNRGDTPLEGMRMYPRIREGAENKPVSSWWMVRGDRLSHPCAFIYDGGMVYGLSASPYWQQNEHTKFPWLGEDGQFYRFSGYTCRLGGIGQKEEESGIGYTLGYENAPWLFVDSRKVKDREPLGNNCFVLEPGEEISFILYVYKYPSIAETGIHSAVRNVYSRYHQSPRKIGSVREAVEDISEPISKEAWLPEENNYSLFVFDRGERYEYRKLCSIAWTNGLSVAVPMLMAAIRTGKEEMRNQALKCIDEIVQNSINPASGLPFDASQGKIKNNRGWWFDVMKTPGHAAYLTGQAMYYILKAYEFEKEHMKIEHTEWLNFAKPVLVKMENSKNSDKEYPYIFSEKTGAGLEYDSFSGSWCMAAIAYYTYITRDNAYLQGLIESEIHYYQAYVQRLVCYGGPLDITKGVDSEGILAYIRAVRYLHSVTGEAIYLDHMRDALEYEFTFKFCYNVPNQVSPLKEIHWSSCGGSVTSVVNPHIHPMSSTIVDELAYYVENTGDTYVAERMKDVIMWGCQTYNTYDGEYGYGKKGWMSERFCYSQGLLTETYPDGSPASTWFALMPWGGASIVEGLAGKVWSDFSK